MMLLPFGFWLGPCSGIKVTLSAIYYSGFDALYCRFFLSKIEGVNYLAFVGVLWALPEILFIIFTSEAVFVILGGNKNLRSATLID